MTSSVTDHELKQIHRMMWGAGEYVRIADLVAGACAELVDRIGTCEGTDLLDVACGTGNVSIPAALRGARVTGVDLTPEHFPAARARADEAGVQITWQEGDAEQLEFPDSSFDRVTSTFGSQFAPRHDRVAAELVRVCRPGGLIGLCNWTEQGWTGQFQRILASYFPTPQDFQQPAMRWGDETYVRTLFQGHPVHIECRLRNVPYAFPSAEHLVRFFEANFGPFITARSTVSPRSRWAQLRADLVDMTETFNTTPGEGFLADVEYLEIVLQKEG
ncbi:methyltransferase domain-containing protein [Streptomyces canus]|uniref:class I SAM-dependent methyltransferase n=1 Tax=Streptomyces canus TaxID=58343 RepID=UPI00339EEE02